MTEDFFELGETNFSPENIAEMMNPALAKQKEQEKRHQQTMMQILSGDSEDNAGPYKLRAIVEHDAWYLPVNGDGRFELLNLQAGEYSRLIAAISKADGRRTNRIGQGGQFIPIYFTLPESGGPYQKLDGRQLARTTFENITGLLIQHQRDEEPRELSHEFFPELKLLADAVEVEDELMKGGPIDTLCLKNFSFIVALYKGKLWLNDGVATVGTHDDRIFLANNELHMVRMPGEEVLTLIQRDAAFGGMVINPGSEIGRTESPIRGLLLSLSHISLIMLQERCALERVQECVVRSREEFELWLTQVYFPRPYEITEETDASGRTFIHAFCNSSGATWNIYEFDRCESTNLITTPKFEVKPAQASVDEIASGISPILCPALMAKSLFLQLPERNRKENHKWLPGKSIGPVRLLSPEDIAAAKRRVKLCNELLKFMPAGAETFPREAIRSVAGARFLSWGGNATTRKWVTDQLEQAKRFDKQLVFAT